MISTSTLRARWPSTAGSFAPPDYGASKVLVIDPSRNTSYLLPEDYGTGSTSTSRARWPFAHAPPDERGRCSTIRIYTGADCFAHNYANNMQSVLDCIAFHSPLHFSFEGARTCSQKTTARVRASTRRARWPSTAGSCRTLQARPRCW